MRRANRWGLIFIATLIVMLGLMLGRSFAPPSSAALTLTVGAETGLAARQTGDAPGGPTGIILPPPTLTPTVGPTRLALTARAYATTHADALGDLMVTVDGQGLLYRVTLTEAEINPLIARYAAEVDNVDHVHLALAPGTGALTADFYVLGVTMEVEATARLLAENGALTVEVMAASLGGIGFPQAAIDAIHHDLVEMINEALLEALAEYGPPSAITVTDVTMGEGCLSFTFRLSAGTTPVASPVSS